jgi:RNA polymerase sigma-70 factor, ECF subfamily
MAADETAQELQGLMRGVVRRDRAAFAALYDQTAPQLFGIAMRILRQREEAEDVLQETFVAVWDRAASFDPGRGSVMTWLVTILRHRAIDRRRRRAHLEDRVGSEADLLALTAAASDESDRGASLAALQKCLASSRSGRGRRCCSPMPMAIRTRSWRSG